MGLQERREREKEQRRQQILDAARELLFEKGLHAATVNQIAKKAELSVGLIYFYFKSKEDIFAALQEEGLDILCSMIQKASEEKTAAKEKLLKIANAYYRFGKEYKSYFDIINYFLTAPERIFPEHLKSQIDEHGDRILSILDSIIETGLQKNELKNFSPRELSIMIWSHIHGFLQFKKLQDTILKNEDYEQLFTRSVTHLLESL